MPSLRFMQAMEGEHCGRFDSDEAFETSNYHIRTTPRREWRIVVEGDAGLADMRAGRRIPAVRELMGLPTARDARLEEHEVTAVVLYTGPLVRRRAPRALSPTGTAGGHGGWARRVGTAGGHGGWAQSGWAWRVGTASRHGGWALRTRIRSLPPLQGRAPPRTQ